MLNVILTSYQNLHNLLFFKINYIKPSIIMCCTEIRIWNVKLEFLTLIIKERESLNLLCVRNVGSCSIELIYCVITSVSTLGTNHLPVKCVGTNSESRGTCGDIWLDTQVCTDIIVIVQGTCNSINYCS